MRCACFEIIVTIDKMIESLIGLLANELYILKTRMNFSKMKLKTEKNEDEREIDEKNVTKWTLTALKCAKTKDIWR